MPPMGTVNLHGSLLPHTGCCTHQLGGDHGEKETGVTTFQLQQDIDTGAPLAGSFSIGETDTGEMYTTG